MKKSILFIASFFVVGFIFFSFNNTLVFADSHPAGNNPTGSSSPSTVKLDNPLGNGVTDVPTLIGRIIRAVLGVVGSLALVMFIYGGFTWMLAAGSSEKVKKGRDIIVWAAIGLVIIFTSYALVSFIIESVGKS